MSVSDDMELARLEELHREGLVANPLPKPSPHPAAIEVGKKEFWDLLTTAALDYEPSECLKGMKLGE